MIRPDEFVRRWTALADPPELTRLSPATLDGLELDRESRALLQSAGLPAEAAPFLSFQVPAAGPLPRLGGVSNSRDENRKLGSRGSGRSLSRYRVIGSDDAGSPIGIDSETGAVVRLDHKRSFQAGPVNASAAAFLESLLVYAEFVEHVNQQGGEDAWLDGRIAVEDLASLRDSLKSIDPTGLGPGALWGRELARLSAGMS